MIRRPPRSTRSRPTWRRWRDAPWAIPSCSWRVRTTFAACWKPKAVDDGALEMNGYNFTDRVRKVLQMAREEAARLHHEYVGTEHILLGLTRGPRRRGPRRAAHHAQEREEIQDPGARSLLPRPHPTGRRRPTRPDDRPVQGNRARDGDPVTSQKEQPRAHRRAGRRQDGDRRRAGPADRGRAGPRRAEGSPRAVARHGGGDRGEEVSRAVRGTAQGGDQRDRPEKEHHPVHRRAGNAGGR